MKNEHIQPDTPATKAWQQMQQLLDAEMPTGKNATPKNNHNRRYTILLLLLLIGGCGVYKLYTGSGNTPTIQLASTKVVERVDLASASVPKKTTNASTNSNSKAAATTPSSAHMLMPPHLQAGANEPLNISSSSSNNALGKNIQKTPSVFNKGIIKTLTPVASKAPEAFGFQTKQQEPLQQPSQLLIGKGAGFNEQPTTALISDKTVPAQPVATLLNAVNDTSAGNKTLIAKQQNAVPTSKKLSFVTDKKLHVALEWSQALQFKNTSLFADVNAKKQPLSLFIPSLLVSRNVSKKSTITLAFNPYSQSFFTSSSTVSSGSYQFSAVSASNLSQPVNNVSISRSFTLSKVIGREVSLQYSYHLNSKWDVSMALENTWTNTALLQEKMVKNSSSVIKDSLYGVVKTDKDWQFINNSFMSAKVNVSYGFKHYRAGLALSKPITPVYAGEKATANPVNAQLFLRWMIR